MTEVHQENTQPAQKPEPKIYRCVPEAWLWLPKPARLVLAWITIIAFSLSFFSPIGAMLLAFPWFWKNFPILSACYAIALVISFLIPLREW